MPNPPAEANSGKRIPVTVAGTILFNTGFDTRGVNLEDTPTIADKAGSSPTAGSQSFFGTARQTRFGLKLDPTPVGDALLTGAFELDAFSAASPYANGINMNLFRLRLAYGRLDWDNFAIEMGQDWSIFAPLNPSSLIMFAAAEFQGSGNLWARIPQLRIEDKLSSRLLWQLAAEDPNDGDFNSAFTAASPPGAGELGRMPALESRLAWSFRGTGDDDYLIGISGRYGRGRNIAVVDDVTLHQPVDSWGVALDYSLPFTAFFNLTGEAYEGRALGIYMAGLGESVGMPGTAGGHGVESRGGWIQTQFNLTNKWQLNLGYGIDSENANELAVGDRNRNQNYFGNVIWKLTPNFELSPEYRRILTDLRNESYAKARGDQAALSAAYLF